MCPVLPGGVAGPAGGLPAAGPAHGRAQRPDRGPGRGARHRRPAAGRPAAPDPKLAAQLRAGGLVPVGQLAVEVGHADQAHLIRDFTSSPAPPRPPSWARPSPPTGDGGHQVNSVQDAVAAASYPGRSRSSVQARRNDARTVGAVLGRGRGTGADPSGGGDAGLRVHRRRRGRGHHRGGVRSD
jgi:hypothetical protein